MGKSNIIQFQSRILNNWNTIDNNSKTNWISEMRAIVTPPKTAITATKSSLKTSYKWQDSSKLNNSNTTNDLKSLRSKESSNHWLKKIIIAVSKSRERSNKSQGLINNSGRYRSRRAKDYAPIELISYRMLIKLDRR